MKHPFASTAIPGALVCDVDSRLDLVRTSTDAEWLQAVIKHRSCQKAVTVAAKRRLKWVNKAWGALLAKYTAQNAEVLP